MLISRGSKDEGCGIRLDGVVGVGDGCGVAVQRFELSPNGIGYPEITRRTSGISMYLQGSNLKERYVTVHIK